MERYVCIHGHFYQPPRENPWLESIELQDSAFPYHDWNVRVSAECYAPNGASRILDSQNRIVRIVNNYGRISFNFGPTLLEWMERHDPEVYAKVLQGDKRSAERFGGHGSAIAQSYHHIIMPLANSRDKRTQILWGMRDFEQRFGRPPAGMWLPETAVDLETLDMMAEAGIKFTILAPHQARLAQTADGHGADVFAAGRPDSGRAYVQKLPSGREIAIFFYDASISQAVAFEGLLKDGNVFAARLLVTFGDGRGAPLVHIATDGETYGHHHRHGDMALAYALDQIGTRGQVHLTNYSQYLEKHPPAVQVEIAELTSWSCAHGVERWRSNCGCRTGGEPVWTQEWRAPLRAALDWLREQVDAPFETAAGELLKDPWLARDEYIEVLFDRSKATPGFLERHARHALDEKERVRALELLEMQRHAMMMYTSCGWFFNDLSGIETVQVLEYAGRVAQLAKRLFGQDLEPTLLTLLEQAKSNIPERGTGRDIYETSVRPDIVDIRQVAAHFAISTLFERNGRNRVYCYSIAHLDLKRLEAGAATLLLGKCRVTSDITGEAEVVTFAVLHLGDHNINGGVRTFVSDEAYNLLMRELSRAFSTADLPAVIRLLDKHFPGNAYSLKSLFRDEQRKILDMVLKSRLAEAEAAYRSVYERHAPLMRFLADLDNPMPMPFVLAAELVLNTDLLRALENPDLDIEWARQLIQQAESAGVELEHEALRFALQDTLVKIAARLQRAPGDMLLLDRTVDAVTLAQGMPFDVDLWKVQNIYYDIAEKAFRGIQARASSGDGSARRWVEQFRHLGALLSVAVV
jgi:alpha-amylase/alpha-mannosidase (GH57 family)